MCTKIEFFTIRSKYFEVFILMQASQIIIVVKISMKSPLKAIK